MINNKRGIDTFLFDEFANELLQKFYYINILYNIVHILISID